MSQREATTGVTYDLIFGAALWAGVAMVGVAGGLEGASHQKIAATRPKSRHI